MLAMTIPAITPMTMIVCIQSHSGFMPPEGTGAAGGGAFAAECPDARELGRKRLAAQRRYSAARKTTTRVRTRIRRSSAMEKCSM